MRLRRRIRSRVAIVLAVIGVVVVVLFGRASTHLLLTAWRDVDERESVPAGYVDDASRLNQTEVVEVVSVAASPAEAEAQLSALLRSASQRKLRVSIAGARHTMGGHTIAAGGIVIDMRPFDDMQLDASGEVLHVQAGATWDEVLAFLDSHGCSIEVMQSNASFTVGGSISANCHGWQPNRPPIISTVQSMRVMLADGNVVRCSREENSQIFSLVAGGYGLFGIILEVELKVPRNENYRLRRVETTVEGLAAAFGREVIGRDDVGLAYARLCVAPGDPGYLQQAVLNVHQRVHGTSASVDPIHPPALAGLKRTVFRGSEASDYGKELRWDLESWFTDQMAGDIASRNQLLSDPVELYQNRSSVSTDILQEYFVPPDKAASFVERLRIINREHGGDLMNVTVRHVLADNDSFLRYADREMLGIVLLFAQPRTQAGEAAMKSMTQALIDAAIECEGRHYLPYRLHASVEQLARAYPGSTEFFRLKRKLDPAGIFENQFWQTYGEVEGGL